MSRWQVNMLLDILDSPEDNQKIYLAIGGILGIEEDEKTGAAYLTESFADVAFRMRDEVIKNGCDWLKAVCEVIGHLEGQEYCKECGQKHKTKKVFNWGEEAQPVHWIIAALIAEVRKEEEAD